MKAVPKASHRTGRVWRFDGNVEKDTSPSPTMRDAPWEHDRGEKPKGSGAKVYTHYVRIVGMDKKMMPKAICKTAC